MGYGYGDDKARFLINTFELKIAFPIWVAIHLQRSTPTRYVSGRGY